jgi:alpha-beta hydrolase superfamily lysophospholipase
MSTGEPQFLNVGDGDQRRRIAYLSDPPPDADGLGLVWLIGLNSDMVSTKAAALAEWAPANGFGLTRFEYSGHGTSSGEFQDATIGDWLEETREVFTKITSGRQIVIGSSTGGHLALLLLRDLMRRQPAEAERIAALVLIAPAWDLTEELMWKELSPEAQREIMEKGVTYRPSEYGDPYPITRKFIEDGRNHLFKGEPFDPGRPVIILQGLLDTAVPASHSRKLKEFLEGDWAELIEVADGEHRMSRPQDLDLLFQTIKRVAGRVA